MDSISRRYTMQVCDDNGFEDRACRGRTHTRGKRGLIISKSPGKLPNLNHERGWMTRLYRNLSTNHDRVSRSLLIKTTNQHHAGPREELRPRHQALVVDRDVRCCHGLRSLLGYVSSPSRCRFPLQIYMIALKRDATPAAVCIWRTIPDLSRRSLVFARPSLLASDGHRRSVDASSRPPQPPSPRPTSLKSKSAPSTWPSRRPESAPWTPAR